MNTDNMAVSGETIDFGPCAFMDRYDPSTVFSSIDVYGRYAYSNQPRIASWNLERFAETLLPLLNKNKDRSIQIAHEAVSKFTDVYHYNWINGMRAKLGLFNKEKEDETLITDLLNMMNKYRVDFTNTFRLLTINGLEELELYNTPEFAQWNKLWRTRRDRQKESKEAIQQLMQENNPAIIPRNHRVEQALESAVYKNDYSVMERLISVLLRPYAYSEDQKEYTELPEPTDQPYRTFCGT